MLFSDRKLEGESKRRIIVQTTISLSFGVSAAVLAAFGRSPLASTPLERRLLALVAIFLLTMAAYLIGLIIRGRANMGTYNLPLERLSWIMTVILFGVFAFNSFTGSQGSLQLLGFGLGILVFGGVNRVLQDVRRAELRTRDKLLRLECQFAELTKGLQSKGN